MTIHRDTLIAVIRVDGVAACHPNHDGRGGLRVLLLTNTPEVRAAVLQAVSTALPHDKVFFESSGGEFEIQKTE